MSTKRKVGRPRKVLEPTTVLMESVVAEQQEPPAIELATIPPQELVEASVRHVPTKSTHTKSTPTRTKPTRQQAEHFVPRLFAWYLSSLALATLVSQHRSILQDWAYAVDPVKTHEERDPAQVIGSQGPLPDTLHPQIVKIYGITSGATLLYNLLLVFLFFFPGWCLKQIRVHPGMKILTQLFMLLLLYVQICGPVAWSTYTPILASELQLPYFIAIFNMHLLIAMLRDM